MLKIPALLMLLTTLSGCRAGEPQTPEQTGTMPYGNAGFAFFTPKGLPAVVTRALIIDSKRVVYTYRALDGTQENSGSVEKCKTCVPIRHSTGLLRGLWLPGTAAVEGHKQ